MENKRFDRRSELLFPVKAGDFPVMLRQFTEDARKDGAEGLLFATACELYLDLQSQLVHWTLGRDIAGGELTRRDIDAAVSQLRELIREVAPQRLPRLDTEAKAIEASGIGNMCDLTREGTLHTRWGHDYCTGMDHSLRRGARFLTSNPAKINAFRKERPDQWEKLLADAAKEYPGADKERMISVMCMKVVALCARRLYPIFEATDGEDGFACIQTNVLNIGDTQKMLDEVLFWEEAFRRELGVDSPNIVYKLPAVKTAVPVVEELVKRDIRVCLTLDFSVSQHEIFAQLMKHAKRRCFVVLMSGFLDDSVAKELEANGIADPKRYAKHAGEAVIRKSYRNLLDKGLCDKVSIMAAAIRGDYTIRSCFTPLANAPIYFTTVTEKILEFDSEPRKMNPEIDQAVPEDILEVLEKSEIFRQAYNRELLDLDNVDAYIPLNAVLNVFTTAFQELVDTF